MDMRNVFSVAAGAGNYIERFAVHTGNAAVSGGIRNCALFSISFRKEKSHVEGKGIWLGKIKAEKTI